MCTIEYIFGAFVVVEIPQWPGTGVVAALATLSQFKLVPIFFFMTCIAVFGRILEPGGQMTTHAGGHNMPPSQHKARISMVELAHLPGAVVVARLAGLAQLRFVLVIFLVATETIQRCLAKTLQVFMARGAFELGFSVRVTQYKLCLVM